MLSSVFLSSSSISASNRLDIAESIRIAEEKRKSLFSATFPYGDFKSSDDGEDAEDVNEDDYDSLFDELDEILKSNGAASGSGDVT